MMIKRTEKNTLGAGLLCLAITGVGFTGEVDIVAAEITRKNSDTWSAKVTLKHADSGWEHYADGWQIVDQHGEVLGDRVLRHPHVDEQPFTRGLSGIKIPAGTAKVFVKAHDKVHGWTSVPYEVVLADDIVE